MKKEEKYLKKAHNYKTQGEQVTLKFLFVQAFGFIDIHHTSSVPDF